MAQPPETQISELISELRKLEKTIEDMGLTEFRERLVELLDVLGAYVHSNINEVVTGGKRKYLYAHKYSDEIVIGLELRHNNTWLHLARIPEEKWSSMTVGELWKTMEENFRREVEAKIPSKVVELLRDIVARVWTRLANVENEIASLKRKLDELGELVQSSNDE